MNSEALSYAGSRIGITLASYRAPVPDAPPARAILLTGTMGSGKTAVTIAIGELLELREQPYALVDLDWLGWVEPARASLLTQRSVLAENLRLIWPTFREAGVERLVLRATSRTARSWTSSAPRCPASACASCAWSRHRP